MRFDETTWNQTRRQFLTSSASGLGAAAFASLLQQDGLLGEELSPNPLAPKSAPLPAKANDDRFSPRALRKARTTRSAAPLSIRHFPMIAARAITMPIPAADLPKAVATRLGAGAAL